MTTGNNKLTQRAKEEGGEEKELTTGIPIDGFADPTGEVPRRGNWFGSSLSRAGLGIKINEVWTSGSSVGTNFDLPMASASIYPFNQANETLSGHSFEMDDTPGNQRILIKHHTGAGVELKQDGSILISSRTHQVQVVGADHELVVSGQGNMTYDGDLNLTVNGNYNMHVGGSYNVTVGANHNHSVHGTMITETGDTHSTIVRGNKDTKVWGDRLDYGSSEHKIITKGDLRFISGNDIIPNAKRGIRVSAMSHYTVTSGGFMTMSSEDTRIIGKKGKIGGPDFHHFGALFSGGEDGQGKDTVFHGNLVGRALEAWTSKFAKFSEHASSAHYSSLVAFNVPFVSIIGAGGASAIQLSGTVEDLEVGGSVVIVGSTNPAVDGEYSVAPIASAANPTPAPPSTATALAFVAPAGAVGLLSDGNTKVIDISGGQEVIATAKPPDIVLSPMAATPEYEFKWGWKAKDRHIVYASVDMWSEGWTTPKDPDAVNLMAQWPDAKAPHEPLFKHYPNTKDWWEVWQKTSPYAVRMVEVDQDDYIENKIAKTDTYSYYFNWTPSTMEIRSKLRTMDGAQDVITSPEKQTDGPKCIESLLNENRLHPTYNIAAPPPPYEVKRTGQSEPVPRFGYTLLGNPVERASKTFLPKNKQAATRTILADPLYNPDRYDAPITSSTKLSKSCTVSKFFGAPGSMTSLEFVPIIKQRQDLARQYYLHAWLMEGIAGCADFKHHRLQVTEAYYNPANGIRRKYGEKEPVSRRYWREPYRKEDGGSTQKSIVTGSYPINQLKYEGRAVVYTLYNSRGKIDYRASFDLALYIRDTFFFDQLSLDYDITRPDGTMSQQLIVVMPKIEKDYKATFEQKVCTYFNRKMFSGADLVEITD